MLAMCWRRISASTLPRAPRARTRAARLAACRRRRRVLPNQRPHPGRGPHSAWKHAIRARRAALEHALQPAVPPRHRRPAVEAPTHAHPDHRGGGLHRLAPRRRAARARTPRPRARQPRSAGARAGATAARVPRRARSSSSSATSGIAKRCARALDGVDAVVALRRARSASARACTRSTTTQRQHARHGGAARGADDAAGRRLVVASSMSVYGEGLYRDAATARRRRVERTRERSRQAHWEPRGPNGERAGARSRRRRRRRRRSRRSTRCRSSTRSGCA